MALKLALFFLSLAFSGLAQAAPAALTYQGRIVKSDGKPLEHSSVSFQFEITNPAGTCVIYREQVNGINMQNSNGIFDVAIGHSHSFPALPSFSIIDSFSNSGAVSCDGGAPYTPAASDGRRLRVQFHDGVSWRLISPDSIIRSVPYSAYSANAGKLGNYFATDYVRKIDINSNVNCDGGSFLTWDASTGLFGCDTPTAGGGSGSVTEVQSANSYLTVANSTSTPTLTVKVGTTANTVAAGNDARFTDSRNPTGPANGDLGGSYPSPLVTGLQGVDVSATAPSLGQVLRYDGTSWTAFTLPAASSGTVTDVQSANSYVTITNSTTTPLLTLNVGTGANTVAAGNDARFTNSRTPSGSAGGDLSGTYPNPSVAKIQGIAVDPAAPSSGQYLRFNGLSWIPANLPAANPGTVTNLQSANSYLSVTDPTSTPTLTINVGTVAGTLAAGDDPRFSNSRAPNGAASGDLTGTYPAPSVAKIRGVNVDATAPTTGQILKFDGSSWVPSTIAAASSGTVTDVQSANPYLTITNSNTTPTLTLNVGTAANTVAAGNDSRFTNSRTPTGTAGGDLGGTYPNPAVTRLQGVGVSSTTPTTGQVLKYDGSAWVASTLPAGNPGTITSITAGAGLTGGTITSSGTIGLDTELTGLAGLTTNGYLQRTAAGAYSTSPASPLATANNLVIRDGSGVADFYGLNLSGSTSGSVLLQAPAIVSSYSLTFPNTQGGANQVLRNNGSGLLTWASVPTAPGSNCGANEVITYSGGSFNCVPDQTGSAGTGITTFNGQTGSTQSFGAVGFTGTAPSWSSSSSVHTLNIPMANTASVTAGLISKAEYDVFNGKQNALGYTPLRPSNNLNDVASVATARTNLGLGTSATRNVAASGDAALTEVVIGNDSRLTNSRAPNGAAGGDLSGTYPSPAVAKLQGVSVDTTTPTLGQVLKYDGTKWAAATLPAGNPGTVTEVTSANAYLTVTNGTSVPSLTLNVGTAANTVAAGNDSRFTNSRTPTGTAGGDLGGTYPNPEVAKIKGTAVAITSLTSGNFLKYNGTNWVNALIGVTDVSGLSTELSSKIDQSQISGTCTAGKTLVFSAVTGTWTCTNIAISSSQVSYGTQTANRIFAAPNGTDGAPSFRSLVEADLPSTVTAGLWAANGSAAYRASGAVGIGTSSPTQVLDIVRSNATNFIRIANESSTASRDVGMVIENYRGANLGSDNYFYFRNAQGSISAPTATKNGNTLGGFYFQGQGATAGTWRTGAAIIALAQTGGADFTDTNSATDINFQTNNGSAFATRMTIDATGNVGIGTSTPTSVLQVVGGVQVGNDAATCSTTKAGTLRYASGTMSLCNGTSWTALSSTIGTVTNVATGAGLTGGPITSSGTISVATGGITSAMILDGTIAAADIATDAVTASEIAANAVTASELAGNAVTSAKILDGTIAAADIAADAVTASEIAANAVTSSELASNSVTSAKIVDGTIAAADIATDAVTASEIAASAVTSSELASNSVTSAKIVDLSIVDADLAAALSNRIWSGGNGTAVWHTTGNVGIRTTAPAYDLHVVGDVAATAFLYTSDRRLKKNIHTLENPLNKVLQLRGVSFDWKQNNQHDIGFIAQEVEAVVPDAVSSRTNDQGVETKSVKYGNLVGLVVEAVKELYRSLSSTQEEVQNLKTENQALKAQLQSLEQRLNALENRTPASVEASPK